MKKHGERAHSKFSASGAERWFNCPGSVELSEGVPEKETQWSKEGTVAHEVLEELMLVAINAGVSRIGHAKFRKDIPYEMVAHATSAANFILGEHAKRPGSDILVETRIYLKFIHDEMFGTFDGAVIDHFDTLDVYDFKYGAGHAVSPKDNLQMIFYALGLAHGLDWNFKRARLWIIQPRIKGYDGPVYWEKSMQELKAYVPIFQEKVRIVEENPDVFVEGSWCHWCKAKKKCPKKIEARDDKAAELFRSVALPEQQLIFGKGELNHGFEEKGFQEAGKEDHQEEKGFEETYSEGEEENFF
jgi:hypothetical protein